MTLPKKIPRTGLKPIIPLSQAIQLRIINHIANGHPFKELGYSRAQLTTWCRNNPTFANDYLHARELSADSMVDRVISVGDSVDEKSVGSSRVKLDAYTTAARLLSPARYGNRPDTVAPRGLITMTDAQLLSRLRSLGVDLDLPRLPGTTVTEAETNRGGGEALEGGASALEGGVLPSL